MKHRLDPTKNGLQILHYFNQISMLDLTRFQSCVPAGIKVTTYEATLGFSGNILQIQDEISSTSRVPTYLININIIVATMVFVATLYNTNIFTSPTAPFGWHLQSSEFEASVSECYNTCGKPYALMSRTVDKNKQTF